MRERDGGAAELARRGGAEPGVDAGGVDRMPARREEMPPLVRILLEMDATSARPRSSVPQTHPYAGKG